jgi:hypothetical protein
VIIVFAATALPLSFMSESRAMIPVGALATVRVVPKIVPVNTTEPVATGQ